MFVFYTLARSARCWRRNQGHAGDIPTGHGFELRWGFEVQLDITLEHNSPAVGSKRDMSD
jgi:hypothetical protein